MDRLYLPSCHVLGRVQCVVSVDQSLVPLGSADCRGTHRGDSRGVCPWAMGGESA